MPETGVPAEQCQYVATVYNNRSETSYTFGPLNGPRGIEFFLQRLARVDPDETNFTTPQFSVLNGMMLLGTGQELSD